MKPFFSFESSEMPWESKGWDKILETEIRDFIEVQLSLIQRRTERRGAQFLFLVFFDVCVYRLLILHVALLLPRIEGFHADARREQQVGNSIISLTWEV